jgi:hypothetical protein
MKATVEDHLALYFATSFSMNTNKKKYYFVSVPSPLGEKPRLVRGYLAFSTVMTMEIT